MQIKFLILPIFFVPFQSFCQTITGKIENKSGEKIPFANITIRDATDDLYIREYTIARNGYYSITLKEKYQRIIIEVTANRYLKDYFIIDNPVTDKNYIHDFNLVKDSIVKLKEVVVNAKARPFQIIGDTTIFNVSAYRDGTERKIEEVIKKLPGVEVNEKTGEIKYKGRSVETVKLDGEDLFGVYYSIGTRNINTEMIEQIQAIENYSDNPLLKGIEGGDKVALNLTLKKRKADYSGNADLGVGIIHPAVGASEGSANLLGISARHKSFATLSYNNIGINNTPFDYFSYTPDPDQSRESGFLAKRVIPETYFDIDLQPPRYNINHSLFTNYNSMFKIGHTLNLKTNLYYLHDKISFQQSQSANNIINGQRFLTSDILDIQKKPFQYRGDMDLKFNSSKKSLLEYKIRFRKEQINTSSNVLQNDSIRYKTDLGTRDQIIEQNLLFTDKLGKNKAIQLLANRSTDNVPQYFSFSPAIGSDSLYSSNRQLSEFRKNVWDIQSILLGNTSERRYSISFGLKVDNNNLNSNLLGNNNGSFTVIDSFANDILYQRSTFFNTTSYRLNSKRWRLSLAYSFSYLDQHLRNNISHTNKSSEKWIFEPTLSVGYRLNNYSVILSTLNYSQKPPTEDHFFNNPVVISTREVRSNAVTLDLQKSKILTFFYLFNNLYRQFQVNAGISLFDTKGNYFLNYFIRADNTKTSLFFLPESTQGFNANFLIEKYLPLFESTLRFKSDYSLSTYKDIVNNSSLRKNISRFLTSEFFFKTALDIKINFENIFKYRRISSNSSNRLSFTNQTLNNNFKVILKPATTMFFILSADYFLPNIANPGQDYLFLDVALDYSGKRRIYEWRFAARNILNNTRFNQVGTNDFSTINFQTNLLPAYFMLNVSRNF